MTTISSQRGNIAIGSDIWEQDARRKIRKRYLSIELLF
jgi:hypothetical protein